MEKILQVDGGLYNRLTLTLAATEAITQYGPLYSIELLSQLHMDKTKTATKIQTVKPGLNRFRKCRVLEYLCMKAVKGKRKHRWTARRAATPDNDNALF